HLCSRGFREHILGCTRDELDAGVGRDHGAVDDQVIVPRILPGSGSLIEVGDISAASLVRLVLLPGTALVVEPFVGHRSVTARFDASLQADVKHIWTILQLAHTGTTN